MPLSLGCCLSMQNDCLLNHVYFYKDQFALLCTKLFTYGGFNTFLIYFKRLLA